MPWKSDAQRKYMWAVHPEIAHEFQEATPKGTRLPEHVKKAKKGALKSMGKKHGENHNRSDK